MTIKFYSILQILLICLNHHYHHQGVASAFVLPAGGRWGWFPRRDTVKTIINRGRRSAILMNKNNEQKHTWTPQDLTADIPGFLSIPDDDYIKKYQQNPNLWPVEFFIIVYRRRRRKAANNNNNVEILVRKSANGTSKYGLGTGVPVTRWIISTSEQPPIGYMFSNPRIFFEAKNYPEFPKNLNPEESWSYTKIDICRDAFNNNKSNENTDYTITSDTECLLHDPDLEEYAIKIRDYLKTKLSDMEKLTMTDENSSSSSSSSSSWESKRIALIKNVVEKENCVAAIQGTLRMSGIFAMKKRRHGDDVKKTTTTTTHSLDRRRYVSLGNDAPDPSKLVESMRIFTMFPQMPDPMPIPSTPPEQLQQEIMNRVSHLEATGRDPHKDKYGRKYTHKSTSNVSNTIHGIYFTIDVTDLLGDGNDEEDEKEDVIPPALDLFGTKQIQREWISLEDLKVLAAPPQSPSSSSSSDENDDDDGTKEKKRIVNISTDDTKPTFISGFIVRQLVKEGVIDIFKG